LSVLETKNENQEQIIKKFETKLEKKKSIMKLPTKDKNQDKLKRYNEFKHDFEQQNSSIDL